MKLTTRCKALVLTVSMTSLSIVSACGKESASEVKDTEIVNKGNYVYFVTPLRDMLFNEKVEAILSAKRELATKLEQAYPKGEGRQYTPEVINSKSSEVEKFVKHASSWLEENEAGIREMGFALPDLVPTGVMFLIGGKASANLGIGGGGSVTAGIVVIPVKITQINKMTKEVVERYSFRWSAIVLPAVQIGTGAGGGGSFRGGLGVIWGKLDHPKDFHGLAGGLSGSVAAAVGHNFKIGILKRNSTNNHGINLFATAMIQTGGELSAELHGFGGPIMSFDQYLVKIGLQDSLDPFENKKSSEE